MLQKKKTTRAHFRVFWIFYLFIFSAPGEIFKNEATMKYLESRAPTKKLHAEYFSSHLSESHQITIIAVYSFQVWATEESTTTGV